MKRVRLMVGTADTLTPNPHIALRPPESVAVQVTVVSPEANSAPEAGVHVIDTGADPPLVVGLENDSAIG
jgi:hypothetical protein